MSGLYITPECAPFASKGGAGIVPGHLLPALNSLGVTVAGVMPLHGCIDPALVPGKPAMVLEVSFRGCTHHVRAHRGHLPGSAVVVWFLENETYFSDGKIFQHDDIPFRSDTVRYSFFARACLELIRRLDPDFVHVNDWTGGFLLGWMELENQGARDRGLPAPFRQRRYLTIHNIGYQGQTWKGYLADADFRELAEHPEIGRLFQDPVYPDCVNPLRLAMELANEGVNLVSPNNRAEVQQADDTDTFFLGGHGLEGVARRLARQGLLHGILNGKCYSADPTDDAFNELMERKRRERTALGRFFDDPDACLFGFVGRAVEQKVVLLAELLDGRPVLEHILEIPGVNVLALATGEPGYESFLTAFNLCRFPDARRYDVLASTPRRKNFCSIIAHDPEMGRRIQLGCCVFLMPSRDEPCGIAQLESLASGTPVLARAVGGLKDTVIPHGLASATGFTFSGGSRDGVLRGLVSAVAEATRVFRDNPSRFRELQKNAFRARFTWADGAAHYRDDMYRI